VQAVTARRALDFVLYVAIALALVASAIWAATTLGDVGLDRFVRWLVLSVSAALVFGYALPPFRTSMRRASFWAVALLLLGIHVGLFLAAYPSVQRRNVYWIFGLAAPFEVSGVGWVLIAAGFRPTLGQPRRRKKGGDRSGASQA
jgi:cytochrome bd-type quinol oxidase subunit 2